MFESVQRPKSRLRFLWPEIADADDAEAAGRLAAWACGFTVVATVIVSFLGVFGAGPASLIDAAVFAGLGFGIYRMSRTAAVLAFLLFMLERVIMFAATGATGGIVGVVMLLCFGNGLRGTFAFHRLKKGPPPRVDEPDRPAA